MKRSDLVVGAEYTYRAGKYGDRLRCVVLSLDEHRNAGTARDSAFRWNGPGTGVVFAVEQRSRVYRDTQPRIALAIETEIDTFVDGRWIGVSQWVPFAARCAEIVDTWAAELERREREAERQRTYRAAERVREQQRREESARRQAEYDERQRQREIEREQERKADAIRAERFEQRIEPVLRELGFEPERDGERITLTLDDAERLSALLGRDVTAEP